MLFYCVKPNIPVHPPLGVTESRRSAPVSRVRSPKGASAEASTPDAPTVADAEEEFPERSVWALTREGIDGGM